MKKWISVMSVLFLVAFITGCGETKQPEKFEFSLVAAKGYKGTAKGTAVINPQTGADISFKLSGLDPKTVYTVFFVNAKSMMFEGVGQKPFTVPVDAEGNANFTAEINKDSYKRYTELAIYANPGNIPLGNPVGVKTTLGPLVEIKTPTMVLEAKLR